MRSALLHLALIGVAIAPTQAGCRSGDEAAGATRPEPSPKVAAAPAEAPSLPVAASGTAPESAPRRERAGIETFTEGEGVTAQPFFAAGRAPTPPPLVEDERAAICREAVAAARAEAEKMAPAGESGGGRAVTLGPSQAVIASGGSVRVTLPYRLEKGAGEAVCGHFVATVADGGAGEPEVRSAEPKEAGPCGEGNKVQLAASHERLKRILNSVDPLRVRDLVGDPKSGEVWVREHGLERARFDWESLNGGEGVWVLARLRATLATLENASTIGDVGLVAHPSGDELVYEKAEAGWRLVGLCRH